MGRASRNARRYGTRKNSIGDKMTDLVNLTNVVNEAEFNKLASAHKEVTFARECRFALDAIKANPFLADIAKKNPESLKMAIYQVAMTGLTLNPVRKHGYLVPFGGKDPKVTFMPGYIGLVHLACLSGEIEWVQASNVYEGDAFLFKGVGELPDHNFDPFCENRGKVKGSYCVAKLKSGDYLVEMMALNKIYDIRNRSESYKKGFGPWKSDEGEMMKKTVIRRAYKLWPLASDRMKEAINILDNNDGVGEIKEENPTEESMVKLEELISSIDGPTGELLLTHVNKKFDKEYESVSDFNKSELDYSIEFLSPYAQKGA